MKKSGFMSVAGNEEGDSMQEHKSLNILIVEDSAMVGKVLVDTFVKLGHTCDLATSVAEARQKLNNNQYELATLDLNLPDGLGTDLLKEFDVFSDGDTQVAIYTTDKYALTPELLSQYNILDYYVKDGTIIKTVNDIDRLYHRRLKNTQSKVLIIDDSSTVRLMLRMILENRSYGVIEAASAKEGLEMIKNDKPDMVILDLVLPDMHGSKVLEKIKSGPKYIDLPVLVLSGSEPSEVMSKVYKLGASDFVKKPFVYEEILLKVDFWVDYYRKNTELRAERKLLKEYQDAVDRSSMVSKSDINGNITFVNDAYCEASGYSRDELIGQAQSIDNHPDMPKETYTDLWNTIQDKKPWHGIVKNSKKDGGYYYVDMVVNPIIDYEGNIVEYISIRKDVTELEEMKNRLKDELHATADNFKDALLLSKQYELAIDESNILSRTSANGRIIYVNDEFCEITGYSREEVIGQNHKKMKHPDTPKEVIENLWETITAGKIWKGLIKNQKKSGEAYWVDSVILPIKDHQDNIIEYMAIRHDVTELLNLHEEIENTQRELIYRMGEAAESRSKETGNHIKRVALISKLLGEKYGLDEKSCDILFTASPMHDIGKIAVPDAILKKPGPLTDEEWVTMRRHAENGFDILNGSDRPILKAAATISLEHHEKWDGSGYPDGKKGEEIHIYGRITAIADVFDALSSDRCYKKAWELERVIELFEEEKGKHFDAELVDLLLGSIDEFSQILETYKDVYVDEQ